MSDAPTAEESAVLDAIDRNIPIEMTFRYEPHPANPENVLMRVTSATAENKSLVPDAIHSLWERGIIQMVTSLDFKNRRMERRAS